MSHAPLEGNDYIHASAPCKIITILLYMRQLHIHSTLATFHNLQKVNIKRPLFKMANISPVHLDGTTLEGGGQLLRLALSLSSLTQISIHVTDIRGKRGPRSAPGTAGGLKPGHLAGAKWLAEATHASTEGLEVKSRELIFSYQKIESNIPSGSNQALPADGRKVSPKVGVWTDIREGDKIIRRESHVPCSTPGSILLVLQAVLPYLVFGPASHVEGGRTAVPLRITIQGGTNVSNSPSIEYVSQVLLPTLSKQLGLPQITSTLHKRGWSTGRNEVGRIAFDILPLTAGSVLSACELRERGELARVHVSILAPDPQTRSSIRDNVIRQLIAYEPEVEILFPVDENSGHEKRIYLLLVAETENGYRLGRDWLYDLKTKGVPLSKTCDNLVSKVVKDLKREVRHGGCVDEFMQDQLVVFQALATGRTKIDCGKQESSLHTMTARWVVETILGSAFNGSGDCEGVGYRGCEVFLIRNEEGNGLTKCLSRVSINNTP